MNYTFNALNVGGLSGGTATTTRGTPCRFMTLHEIYRPTQYDVTACLSYPHIRHTTHARMTSDHTASVGLMNEDATVEFFFLPMLG